VEVSQLGNAGGGEAQEVSGGGPSGPLPPYGPPIHDAIASGDVQRMKAVAEGARKALYEVEFAAVPADRVNEVIDALRSLDEAIARLDTSRQAPEADDE
jgi:hypothetical protein